MPKIAQKKVDEAKLDIQGVHVLETTSNSYLMEINSTITTKGGIKANVDPFEGEMYLEDYEPHVAFATLSFPKTNNNKHQIVNVSQHLTITESRSGETGGVIGAAIMVMQHVLDPGSGAVRALSR